MPRSHVTHHVVGAAIVIAVVLIAIATYVPVVPQDVEQDPDLSFRATTHDAFARKMQIGIDLVTTYGPWGILQRGYDRRTDGAVLLASLLLACVFAWSITCGAIAAGGNALVTGIAVIAASSLLVSGGHDARFSAIAVLSVLSLLLPSDDARELPLIASLGLVAQVKFTLFVLAVAVAFAAAITRRRPAPIIVFAVSFLLAWIAAGQYLTTLEDFLLRGWQLSAGYSEAQAVGSGVPLAMWGAVGFLLLVVAIERNLLRTMIIAGVIAYVLKVGYARADLVHVSAANALLLFFLLGYAAIRSDRVPRLRNGMRIIATAGALLAVISGGSMLTERLRATVTALPARERVTLQAERDLIARSEAALVPRVAGSIDAYPWGSAGLITSGLEYSPRPVFQSYFSWTPALAKLNTDHLVGPRAPSWLWVSVASIDQILPSLGDAASWRAMMRAYEVVPQRDPTHLLLRRRQVASQELSQALPPVRARPGEWFDLPVGPLLWMKLGASESVSSRLDRVFARPEPLWIEVDTSDGQRSGWRLTRELISEGFIMSPLLTSTHDLRELFEGRASNQVTRVRLVGAKDETFTVRLERISFATRAPWSSRPQPPHRGSTAAEHK